MVFGVQLAALVLLGCRVEPGFALPATARGRVEQTADAFRQGVAPAILVCGGKRWSGITEADELSAALRAAGIPDAAIEQEGQSHCTFQNARCAARILLPRGQVRIGLVTCDWHMPRALRCFRWAGFVPAPIPVRTPEPGPASSFRRALRERASLWFDRLQDLRC